MADVDDLLSFLGASPSPYHAVAEASRRLVDAGFVGLDPAKDWPVEPGRYFVRRGGALVAWSVSAAGKAEPAVPFRIIGAHTDSPNLRIKPRPDTGSQGWHQVAVEVYGGILANSWLDRDLGLSGRVALSSARRSIPSTREMVDPFLVRVDEPLFRIPQLAIHLDRQINSDGLKLNPQQHLTPIWGAGPGPNAVLGSFLVEARSDQRINELLGPPGQPDDFAAFLAGVLSEQQSEEIRESDIASWDLMLHDLTPPSRLGRDGALITSARIDNLLSCWAAVEALLSMSGQPAEAPDPPVVPVVCLYDHEEVGSTSATGADGAFLGQILEQIVLTGGGDRQDLLRSLAGSVCASADGAHATHPNYPERHDPGHHVSIDGGPVIKVNANQRYATDTATAAVLVDACERAASPYQWFVSRNDQPCGSTIGPATAAALGVPTVDVGVAMLSMHSVRELCGATDPIRFVDVLAAFLDPSRTAPTVSASMSRR